MRKLLDIANTGCVHGEHTLHAHSFHACCKHIERALNAHCMHIALFYGNRMVSKQLKKLRRLLNSNPIYNKHACSRRRRSFSKRQARYTKGNTKKMHTWRERTRDKYLHTSPLPAPHLLSRRHLSSHAHTNAAKKAKQRLHPYINPSAAEFKRSGITHQHHLIAVGTLLVTSSGVYLVLKGSAMLRTPRCHGAELSSVEVSRCS